MDPADWAPTYEAILEDLGYPREADEEAARDLDALLVGKTLLPEARLRMLFRGRHAVVFGAAPGLEEAAEPFRAFEGPKVAADGALERVLALGIEPQLVTTDLDKSPERQVELNADGTPLVVHAHGDNRDALKRWVPAMEGPLVGTCQCPTEGLGLERVRNVGGFTDGDRGACLAAHYGASQLLLVGWDFEAVGPGEGTDKANKLAWAERIVEGLDVPVTVV